MSIKCNECGYEGNHVKTVDATEKSSFNCEVCPQCNSHHIDFYVDGYALATAQINQIIDHNIPE